MINWADLEKNINDFNESLCKGPVRSLRPPKAWWDRVYGALSQKYGAERAKRIAGGKWYHEMSGHERASTRHAEGKKYGPAK